ncbi:hypothetical protein N0V83_007331 [Neocucurbitaria cava]|uniref:Uncharacterized protein n=1 Tax=Neocucurbitaria cava TaxID=798079 RepID=A0A9W8Y355_9PLEO|nr:hypothetical protein N0V83_007331 [Neocucurbitaria cava]
MQMPNPLKSLLIVADFETLLALLPAAVSSSVLVHQLLSFQQHPGRPHVRFSVLTTGKFVDKSYRRHAKKLGVEIEQDRRQDLTEFPVERARLELTIPIFILLSAFVIIYGWIMPHHANQAGPVIVLLVLGYCMIAVYQVLSVLLVDLHPRQAATASAANNLLRCELGAAFAAFISPMIDGIGTGWSYTEMALITVIMIPGLFLTMIRGIRWRKSKAAKQEAKKSKVENSTSVNAKGWGIDSDVSRLPVSKF